MLQQMTNLNFFFLLKVEIRLTMFNFIIYLFVSHFLYLTMHVHLFQELVEDFIFPFSKVYLQLEHSSEMPAEQVSGTKQIRFD